MKRTIWVLLDNRMGSVGQAKGIMQELDPQQFNIVEKKLEYSRWAALPNFLRRSTLLGIINKEVLSDGVPDLIISTSRRTAPAALYLKRKHPKIILTQLMFAGNYGAEQFARIFLPQHDAGKKPRDNFYFTVGSPHRVNQSALSAAEAKWRDKFAHLPKPLTAVIVGGSIKGKPFTTENATNFALAVKALKERIGGSLLITDSRRTGVEQEKIITDILKDIPAHTFLWGSKDENPIMGYYACADNFAVSGDSVSMCCEACGTGKPVFVFEGKDWLTPKHHRFVKSLYDGGYAAPLANGCEKFEGGKILYPSAEIAAEITALLNK